MSLSVVLRETALRNLASIRSEDKGVFSRRVKPSRYWLISRIRTVQSHGAPQVAIGCMQATSGSYTKSMMMRKRYLLSTSESSPEPSAR